MGDPRMSEEAYVRVERRVKSAGSATHLGEQRNREGKKLHELVDPKAYGAIRRSITWLEPEEYHLVLLRGVAMLEETRLDTTGSMGGNVDIAMRVLPATYKLLATGEGAVLGRYDTQMMTAIFGDVSDRDDERDHSYKYVLQRSQAEKDARIAEQMTLMVPKRDGGDAPEDSQYGLFAGAYLTWSSINQYGLRYYDFTVSDAPGKRYVDARILKKVFGESVFEYIAENGHQIDEKHLPNINEIATDLLKNAHAFFLQVGDESYTADFWKSVLGEERVVVLPRTELLPQVKAAIIGLTECTLDLQSVEDFLRIDRKSEEFHGRNTAVSKEDARAIRRAVTHIPIGAQVLCSNFDKIPLCGAKFAKKGDIWPMNEGERAPKVTRSAKKPKSDTWL